MLLPPADHRLSFVCPQPPARELAEVRLNRFPPAADRALAGQIGPLANLRSSPGCGVSLATDSPWLALRLARLRHHQPVPQGLALEVRHDDGWLTTASEDLRERDGDLTVRLATGLRPGEVRPCIAWLPPISTCAVAGVEVADGAEARAWEPPPARWLAIGDSLTQGFSLQCPTQTWVHRCARAWDSPAWNLGVGGIRIEPEAFAWALAERRWDLVVIALGSNHCWRASEAEQAADRARILAGLALAGGHGRVAWVLPPWKPCEEGKGPPDFAGMPLDADTGARVGRVREALRAALAPLAPRLLLIGDLMPHDARLYPDGLHPFALGMAAYAGGVARALAPR